MIPEGLIRDRIERLAQRIFNDYRDKEVLDIFIIMNSAFKYFSDLLVYLNRFIEANHCKLMIRPSFFKITSYHLTQ